MHFVSRSITLDIEYIDTHRMFSLTLRLLIHTYSTLNKFSSLPVFPLLSWKKTRRLSRSLNLLGFRVRLLYNAHWTDIRSMDHT